MQRRSFTRRRFLAASLGLGSLAVAIAACGGSTTPGQRAATPGAESPPTTVPSASAPTAAPTIAAAAAPTTAAASGATATPPTAQAAPAAASGSQILLNGAGSTFDNPLFSKAFSEYSKLHPNVQVNYQSVGSGAGIQQLTKGTVDFGATDAPMTDQQVKDAGGDVIHLPVTLGAVAVAYNLPGVADGLKLDGTSLASIFLGTITAWNDPAIARLNPDKQLPNVPVAVVHRSDGSGTSDIFTTYLSQVSPDWKSKVGSGSAVNWPVGIGGKGSEGVAGQVKQTPGGVGYFELAYAKQNSLTSAAVSNGAGSFLVPSSDGASGCAASVAPNLPADLRVRIAGCSGASAYAISGFSWIVFHQNQADPAHGKVLVDLFWWLVHTGQTYSAALYYAPLPDPVVKQDEEKLRSVASQGKPIQIST